MKKETLKGDGRMSWEKVRLSELCNMNSGGTPSRAIKEYYIGDIPWAKISDIESAEGGIVNNTEEHITKAGLDSINNRIFPKGTLLLAMYGSVGKAAFTGIEMSTNQAILGIRIKEENRLDYSFLKYWFQTIKTQLLNRAVGGTLQNISLGIVKDLEIPLPPLPIQQRIAKILDAADALRRKDQELLRKYDELAQAIFIDMFGDPVKNEKGWKEQIIKDVAAKGKHSIKAGPFGSSLKKEYYKQTGFKIYGQEQVIADDFSIGDYYIDEEKFNELKNCSIQSGDVLISLVGTYGKISVVPEVFQEGIINPRLMKISLNRSLFNPYFFKFLLQTEHMYNRIGTYSRGGTMDIVNVGIISEVIVILPPLDLQNRFMEILNSINEQKKVLQKKISDNLFESLLQQAFKGELVE